MEAMEGFSGEENNTTRTGETEATHKNTSQDSEKGGQQTSTEQRTYRL